MNNVLTKKNKAFLWNFLYENKLEIEFNTALPIFVLKEKEEFDI